MFGRGRQSNGILVQPTSFEEAENLGLEGFRNLIWSVCPTLSAESVIKSSSDV